MTQGATNVDDTLKEAINIRGIQEVLQGLATEGTKVDSAIQTINGLSAAIGGYLSDIDRDNGKKKAEEINKSAKQIIRQLDDYIPTEDKKSKNKSEMSEDEPSVYDASVSDLKTIQDKLQTALDNFNKEHNPSVGQKIDKRAQEARTTAATGLENAAETTKNTFVDSGKSLNHMKDTLTSLIKGDIKGAKDNISAFNESFKQGNLASKAITGTAMAAATTVLASVGLAVAGVAAGLGAAAVAVAAVSALAVGIKDAVQQTAHFAGKGARQLVNNLQTNVAEFQKAGLEKDQMNSDRKLTKSEIKREEALVGKLEKQLKVTTSMIEKRGINEDQILDIAAQPSEKARNSEIKKLADGNKSLEGLLKDYVTVQSEITERQTSKSEKFEGLEATGTNLSEKIGSKKDNIGTLKEKGEQIKAQERPKGTFETIHEGQKVGGLKGTVNAVKGIFSREKAPVSPLPETPPPVAPKPPTRIVSDALPAALPLALQQEIERAVATKKNGTDLEATGTNLSEKIGSKKDNIGTLKEKGEQIKAQERPKGTFETIHEGQKVGVLKGTVNAVKGIFSREKAPVSPLPETPPPVAPKPPATVHFASGDNISVDSGIGNDAPPPALPLALQQGIEGAVAIFKKNGTELSKHDTSKPQEKGHVNRLEQQQQQSGPEVSTR